MANAGTVTIDFAAETARFTAEVKKVRGQLADLQKQTQSVGRAFSSAGNLLKGAFAGVTIGAAIRAVVRNTAEAEEASAKLENALKSSGAAATLTADQLKNYASQLQRTSTFGDEAIQGVETLLLSFKGLSGDTVLKATSAVLDLSTRMGVDLRSAAILVGKALSDPAKGLTALVRAGVTFEPAQQRTIKGLLDMGQAAKAQAIILKELEGRFGGAAAAARDTFGGALTGVQNAFGDLLEAKGGMPGATAALNELATTMSDPKIKEGFDSLIGAISTLIELSAKAAAALPTVGSAIGDIIAKYFVVGRSYASVADVLRTELAVEEEKLLKRQVLSLGLSTKEIENQKAYIETLKERIQLAEQLGKVTPPEITPVATTVQSKTLAAPGFLDLDEATRQKQLESRQRAVTASIATMSASLDAFDAHMDELEKRITDRQEKDVARNNQLIDESLRRHIEAEDTKRQVTIDSAAARYDAEVEFERQKETLQKGALAAGIGLLQALSVRSKTAAKALILVNRGVAIAQVVQNTIAAASKALAIYGPTPAGYAAAASAKVWGAVQIGLLAATTGLEISNVNSGNAGGVGGSNLGTPSNPLPVTDGSTVGATQRTQIQLTVEGIVTSGAARAIAEALRDVIDNSDVVLFSSRSQQAAEIRGD